MLYSVVSSTSILMPVPNVPCGVESSLLPEVVCVEQRPQFLMYRVELKVNIPVSPQCYYTSRS